MRDDDKDRERKSRDLAQLVFSRGSQSWKKIDQLRYLPDGNHSYPEVAVIGEAHSGKTQLIRALTLGKRYGRSSSRPGSTNRIEFFNIGGSFLLVDTPGFGYWEAQKAKSRRLRELEQASWYQSLTLQYLAIRNGANLRHVYWTIPANKPELSPTDKFIGRFLAKERIPFTVLVTKMDAALRPDKRRKHKSHPEISSKDAQGEDDGDELDSIVELPSAAARRKSRLESQTYSDITTRLSTLLKPFLSVSPSAPPDRPSAVPILDVSARARHNIDVLAIDMMYNIMRDVPVDRLNLETLNNMSFAPATAEYQIAVEKMYTPALAQQLYVANADFLAFEARGETPSLDCRSVLGEAPGSPLLESTVQDHLPLASPQLERTGLPAPTTAAAALLPDSIPIPLPAPQSLAPQPLKAADSTLATSSPPSTGLTSRRSANPVRAGDEDAPVDASPRSISQFLNADLNRRAAARGFLTKAPAYSSLDANLQVGLMRKPKSVDRYEAAVDGVWDRVLMDPEPFKEQIHRGAFTERDRMRRRLKKFVKMSDRREPDWTTELTAFTEPYMRDDDRHAVRGAQKLPDRGFGQGYRLDGLKTSNVFGVSANTNRIQRKTHKWAVRVTKGVHGV